RHHPLAVADRHHLGKSGCPGLLDVRIGDLPAPEYGHLQDHGCQVLLLLCQDPAESPLTYFMNPTRKAMLSASMKSSARSGAGLQRTSGRMMATTAIPWQASCAVNSAQ